jgi:N-acyl-D-amino-acid deacylase
MNYLRVFSLLLLLASCTEKKNYDIIIRHGMIYDGSGGDPYMADVGINADTIAFIGDLGKAKAAKEIDAMGRAVTPGFINMLSWANESLIQDGLSKSDILQGVTTEVMGEGWSMGPLNDSMKAQTLRDEADIKYPITWTSLGEYLNFLEKKGIACNVASFVGATTVRQYYLSNDDKQPSADTLNKMCDLVREAMREGALGVGSSLIYVPAFYAKTPEIVALCKAAGEYGGMYISHMRSEGNTIEAAVDELITIAREANVPAEIYHYKMAGVNNWNKLSDITKKVEDARAEGLKISADMYMYTAGATGLYASIPPWVQDGGTDLLIKRLLNPAIRAKVIQEMKTASNDWENTYLAAGSPDSILLASFKNDSLKKYQGKMVGEVARMRNKSPEETLLDLIIEDRDATGAIYFIISEDNIKKAREALLKVLEPAECKYLIDYYQPKEKQFLRFWRRTCRNLGVHSTQRNEAQHVVVKMPLTKHLQLHKAVEHLVQDLEPLLSIHYNLVNRQRNF